MPFCNHRMLEGGPLHYYAPTTSGFVPSTSTFSFFNRFQFYGSSNMTEDVIMPHSPNGFQSDSDNSVSSVDISPKELRMRLSNGTKTIDDVQCQWVSCGILFESLDQLATHVGRVHASSGSDGLFYCGWKGCSRNHKGFNARYKMLVHVRTHTNEKPHQCSQCEKSFSRAENLKIHSRSHSGEKPYVCPVPGCQKAYSNSSDRFKHTRTHQVDKPYHCKVPGCPKRYTDPSSLRKHVKTYKHFVNSKSKQDNVTPTPIIVKNETDQKCTSPERCRCVCPCYKTEEFIKLNAYNLENGQMETWNMILNPYIPQPKLFKPYELEERMDIDLPLDLSIHRRHV